MFCFFFCNMVHYRAHVMQLLYLLTYLYRKKVRHTQKKGSRKWEIKRLVWRLQWLTSFMFHRMFFVPHNTPYDHIYWERGSCLLCSLFAVSIHSCWIFDTIYRIHVQITFNLVCPLMRLPQTHTWLKEGVVVW